MIDNKTSDFPSTQECKCLLSVDYAPIQKYIDHAIAAETHGEWQIASSLWSKASERANELSRDYKEDADRCRMNAIKDISKKSVMDKPTDPAFRAYNDEEMKKP